MSVSAWTGPILTWGQTTTAPGQDYNPDAGPNQFYQGSMLLDPRAPFTYLPGGQYNQKSYGFMSNEVIVIDQVPSAIADNNIAASQTPAAAALTLVSSSGAGITVGVSITNSSTGAAVTGLLAIDSASSTPVTYGDNAAISAWDVTKMIARNVRITSGGNDSGITFAVVGYDVYGFPMSEAITGANAGVASGVKAFKYITSITPSASVATTAKAGTGDVIGLPIRVDTFGYLRIFYNTAVVTANTGFVAAVTTSPATTTTGDTRGTYALQSASDASKRLTVFITPSISNIKTTTGLFGVSQNLAT